jgi:hypothetical protein
MLRRLFFTFFLLSSLGSAGQSGIMNLSSLSPDPQPGVRCFCTPGVRNRSASKGLEIAYAQNGASTFAPQSTPLQTPYSATRGNSQLIVGLKVPLLNKPGFKLVLGAKLHRDRFDFRRYGEDFRATFDELDHTTLQSMAYDVMASKALNERQYVGVRVKYTSAGNYDDFFNFAPENRILAVSGLFAMKKGEDRELGYGFAYTHSFRRRLLLPLFLWNQTFNSKWGIESMLPANFFVRRNFDAKTLSLAGVEYLSQSYRLAFNADQPFAGQDFALNYSSLLASVTLERRFLPWIGGYVKLGYQYNFRTDFRAKSVETQGFDVRPTSVPFLRMGVFVAKPR